VRVNVVVPLFIFLVVVDFVTVQTAVMIMSVFMYILPLSLYWGDHNFIFCVMFDFFGQVLGCQHKLVKSCGILFHCF